MKRKVLTLFCTAILVVAAFVYIKETFPLYYAEAPIRNDSQAFILGLQDELALGASECAQRYLYYKTDWHDASPGWVKIKADEKQDDLVCVRIHNPNVLCDSERARVDEVFLEIDSSNKWVVRKHLWAHKGRGHFGYTTKPTT